MNGDRERCPQCGALLTLDDKYCPSCGLRLDEAAPQGTISLDKTPDTGAIVTPDAPAQADAPAEAEPRITHPTSIEELQLYAAQHHMPLEKMRFFVGVDMREPRAFGIYREGDQTIVYKNKADGSRAVRYHGPDEAYAVNELFQKLLQECHNRGIYPDGVPEGVQRQPARSRQPRRSKGETIFARIITIIEVIAFVALVAGTLRYFAAQRDNGYYCRDDTLYYRDGSTWYYYDDDYDDWLIYTYLFDDYADYYVGSSYDAAWDEPDVTASDTWEDYHPASDQDDSDDDWDYDSWDSSDTDWDSDW